MVLGLVQLISRHTGRSIAFAVVQETPLVVFWIMGQVAYRRSVRSEERNWLLYEPTFGRSGSG